MGVEDNYFNITDLDSNTTFFDWIVKENTELISKLNLMNIYGVSASHGLNVVIGTTGNSGGASVVGGDYVGLTGSAIITLADEIPGVTVAGDLVVTGSFSFGSGASANPYINRTPNTQIRFPQGNTGEITPGMIVRISSGSTAQGIGVTAAKANSERNAESIGMVRQVNTESVDVITSGYVEITGDGLTAEQLYYLSGTADGGYTATKPVTVGWYAKPVLLGIGRTHGIVLNYDKYLIAGGDTCGYGCGITGPTGATGATASDPIFVSSNQLINGAFDIWQRNVGKTDTGTILGFRTGSRYFSDRWCTHVAGYNQAHARGFSGEVSKYTIKRYGFTKGQSEVLGNPNYWVALNYLVAGATGATTNFIGVENRIEGGDKYVDEKLFIDGYIRVQGVTTAEVPVYLKRSKSGVTYEIENITTVTVPGTNTPGGKATAKVTFGGVGDDAVGGEIIFIRSADGEGISYEVGAGASGNTAGFTGALVGGGATTATNLAYTIGLPSNHGTRITTNTSGSILFLTQATIGAVGNNLITENLTNTTVLGFTGGQDHGGWKEFFVSHNVGSSGPTTEAYNENGFLALGADIGGYTTGITFEFANWRLFSTQGGTLEKSPYRQETDIVEELKKCQRYYYRTYDQDAALGKKDMETASGTGYSGFNSKPPQTCWQWMVSPLLENWFDFPVEMRGGDTDTNAAGLPTINFYSPYSGSLGDGYNIDAGRDMKFTSGTYGYNNAPRTQRIGEPTLIAVTSQIRNKGFLIAAESGAVAFDTLAAHIVVDIDLKMDLDSGVE